MIFSPLSCGDHPVKQSGKKAAFKLVSTPQFVHSNDHTNREAELKKKRVSSVPWGRGLAWTASSSGVVNGRAKARMVGVVEAVVEGGREDVALIFDFVSPFAHLPSPLLSGLSSQAPPKWSLPASPVHSLMKSFHLI